MGRLYTFWYFYTRHSGEGRNQLCEQLTLAFARVTPMYITQPRNVFRRRSILGNQPGLEVPGTRDGWISPADCPT